MTGPATHLVLGYLNAKEVNERGGETLLSATLPSWASKMRSTLFRVDETRPGPPSIKEDGEEDGVRPGEKKHLCLVSDVIQPAFGVGVCLLTMMSRSTRFSAVKSRRPWLVTMTISITRFCGV